MLLLLLINELQYTNLHNLLSVSVIDDKFS